MRFEGPLYEGDSVLRPGPAFGQDTPQEPDSTAEAAELVQRKIAPANPDGQDIDMIAIEARARAMRAAMIARWFARLGDRLSRWLESGRRRSDEAYLARAQTHAELEARMRELERRGYVPHL